MSHVNTYLNFTRNTEEAFNFYKSVFKTEFKGVINRLGDFPREAGQPELPDEDKNLVMHVALPTIGDHVLMGTDVPESSGYSVQFGNNVVISLEPDTLEEAQSLFDKLSAGGVVEMSLQKMFWGAYYASFTDKFGVRWMINGMY